MTTPGTLAARFHRGFTHAQGSWYSQTMPNLPYNDEIMIGAYDGSGGTLGEFAVRWYQGESGAVARLEVYDDAWAILPHFTDLLAALTSSPGASPETFCQMLREMGIQDDTMRNAPRRRLGQT